MKKIVTLTVAMAAMAGMAVAQIPAQNPAQPQRTPANMAPAGAMPGAMANPNAAVANNASASVEAQDFVKKAAASGLYEVHSSQIATTASQSQEVKQFAQQMISDHQAANQELKQIAASKSIQVPSSIDQKHMDMMKKLMGAQGAEFDQMYVEQQKKAHEQAIQLFQKAANQLDDAELKAFAAKTLPVLQHHAEMVNSLSGTGQTDNE